MQHASRFEASARDAVAGVLYQPGATTRAGTCSMPQDSSREAAEMSQLDHPASVDRAGEADTQSKQRHSHEQRCCW